MSGIKYATAMLAAGGVVGAAATAQAYTTVTLDLPVGQAGVYISLGAGDDGVVAASDSDFANFYYGLGNGSQTVFSGTPGFSETLDKGYTGLSTTTPGMPAPGESYTKGGTYDVTDVNGVSPGVDEYLHIEFADFEGSPYEQYFIGTAMFDSAGDLETITYQPVPEPASWALLLAGVGLTGGALRGARRRRQAIAA